MELELTESIGRWLDEQDTSDEHIRRGATLLLRVNRNRIFYDNVMRSPARFFQRLSFELNRIYSSRRRIEAEKVTAQQLKQMSEQADAVMKPRQRSEFQRGKRADHDSLPAEIQALYADNDAIRAKMRRCHEMMKSISTANSTCPDSDRYPWAKELLRLNRIYKDNWAHYDSYEAAQQDN